MRPEEMRSVEDMECLGRELLGIDAAACTGVVHSLASWVHADGSRVALYINKTTPRSTSDFFLLNLARARSQAILSTGAILCAEPDLSHDLQGPGIVPQILNEWRHQVLGLREVPVLLILTSGQNIDPEHPAFHSAVTPLLFVPEDAAYGLVMTLPEHVEVVGHSAPNSRSAIAWLQQRGLSRITVEAGPSAASALYEAPCLVDELWRSTYLERGLAAEVIGSPTIQDHVLQTILPIRSGGTVVHELNGAWKFERRARAF